MHRFLSAGEENYHHYKVYIFMESRFEHLIPSPLVFQALQILQKEHPFLRASIRSKEGHYEFYIPEKPVLHFREVEHEPESYIHSLMNEKIDPDKLFEAVLLQYENKSIFITLLHHAIADGISNVALHQRFFDLLELLIKGVKPKSLKAYPLPSPLIKRIPKQYQKMNASCLLKKYTHKSSLSYLPGDFETKEDKEIHRIKESLNEKETKKLKEHCKKRQVSINACLCAFLLKTASQFIESKTTPFNMAHDVPVNVRASLTPPASPHELASYNSVFFSQVTLNHETSVWKIAGQIHATTRKSVEPKIIYETIVACEEMFNSGSYFEDPDKVFLYTTNLGQVHFQTNLLKISEFRFHACCFVPFLVSFNTFNGKLCFSFIFTTPFLTKKFMQNFCVNFIKEIKNELKEK